MSRAREGDEEERRSLEAAFAAALHEKHQRILLVAERSRLQAQAENLTDRGSLLNRDDKEALAAHAEMLREHTAELQAFHDALEAFHTQYGPLGD